MMLSLAIAVADPLTFEQIMANVGTVLGQMRSVLVEFGMYDLFVATFGVILVVSAVRYLTQMWGK
jgi:hypothetical protein